MKKLARLECMQRSRHARSAQDFRPASRRGLAAFIHAGGKAAKARGFTLIEIIIVIGLIALIGTFALNKILGGADRAKVHLAQAEVDTLAGKIEQYQQDVGSLPPNLEALVTAPANSAGWLGPYAKEAELKDPWGQPLEYHVPGQGAPYDLISYGRDGKPGGEAMDADIRHQ